MEKRERKGVVEDTKKVNINLKDGRIIKINNGKWMCRECNIEIENIRGAPGHLRKHRISDKKQKTEKRRKENEKSRKIIEEEIKKNRNRTRYQDTTNA